MLRPCARFCLALTVLFLILVTTPTGATDRPTRLHGSDVGVRHGGLVSATRAEVDTTYLLGGPDRLDGTFENSGGQPDWHGWTHRDTGCDAAEYWQISDHQPLAGPYSMWCGTIYDDGPGYGNNWEQWLVFSHTVPDPQQPSTVRWTGQMRTDTEPDYDFVHLDANRGDEWETLASYDGAHVVAFEETFVLDPGEYAGDASDEIQLRVRFTSDGAWSDEDGLFSSEGACWLDDLVVRVDGVVVSVEDFDDQDSGPWQQFLFPGVGDFAQLWIDLQDDDICTSNFSAQVAFIDDGIVVPGTGGTQGQTWRYGPGGFIVNNTGGLMGLGYYLHNIVESPVLEWPDGADAARFEFDVYRHEELGAFSQWPGMFYNWNVRSTADPVAEPIAEQVYHGRSFVYSGGPEYLRHRHDVSDLFVPDRTQVQVSMQLDQWGYLWGWIGTDGTPAPYFDNVAVLAWQYGGPHLAARMIDLANDGFPAQGDVDYLNLASNSVRFDMALNIAPPDHLRNDPGDSLVVSVTVLRSDAELVRPPRMYVHMRANQLFDLVRTLPSTFSQDAGIVSGYVEGDTVFIGGYPQDRYSFDLPDTGFFYPGDVIHYYIEAGDVLAGEQRWATLPADTTDFMAFATAGKYDRDFVVRALPSLHDAVPGAQPPLLVWDDAHGRGGWNRWSFALQNLGFGEGIDYDLYITRSASSGVGNGLGGRATVPVLAEYETLLYTAANLSTYLLSNGDYSNDPSADLDVVSDWFALGGKSAFMTGDNLYDCIMRAGMKGQVFLAEYLGAEFVQQNLRPLVASQIAPTVQAIPGSGIFNMAEQWVAYGGCPGINTFDAVTALSGAQPQAEFLDLNGSGGVYPYVATLLNVHPIHGTRVVSLPYDLRYVRNAPGWTPPGGYEGIPVRALLLNDVLTFFGHHSSGPPVDAPVPQRLVVQQHPNPFNPRTTIALDLPRGGNVSLRIYNVRGALVRVLTDGPLTAGHHDLVWDGLGRGGNPVASGIYFAEVRTLGEVRMLKMALVR